MPTTSQARATKDRPRQAAPEPHSTPRQDTTLDDLVGVLDRALARKAVQGTAEREI